MVVVQINATCEAGSTGKICASVSDLLTKNNVENHILFNSGTSAHKCGIRYGTDTQKKAAAFASRLFGNWGFEGAGATKQLIKYLEKLDPDVIHLHNLHSHACDLELLFDWIKKRKIKVFWTFHDCWAFTGYCMYYDASGCEKWKEGCGGCPQRKTFSWLFDKSEKLLKKKKALFDDLDLTIITPSDWLATQVRMSFLSAYPLKVIHNGIDLSVFSPFESDFRKKYDVGDRFLVLGVAMIWEKRKGIDTFIELSRRLGDKYRIVLVGGNAPEDDLPENIICIRRTKDQKELAGIYSAADVFVNPTREDNFPTTNLEALACGTPVLTFDTGGSPEALDDSCGKVVPKDDTDALEKEIIRICESKPYRGEACVERAKQFDQNIKFAEYIDLYREEKSI